MVALDALDRTRRDYDEVAELYDDLVRRNVDPVTDALSRAMVNAFADLVRIGSGATEVVVDAGCGPGQWTEHLDRTGLRVHGVDLSPAMIDIARRHSPGLSYAVGSILDLDFSDGSVGGVLAHFSIIHTPPALVPHVLKEFARVLSPGGALLLGVQVADTAEPEGWVRYAHRASPAYLWTLDALTTHLREQCFTEISRLRIVAPTPEKPAAGYLLARRVPLRP